MIHASVDGNIGRDAEIRKSAAGKDYISFSVACNRKTIDGSKEVYWVGVTGPQEKLAKYLLKGTAVVVHGELTTAIDKTGKTHLNVYASQIRLLGGGDKQPQGTQGRTLHTYAEENHSDIPF